MACEICRYWWRTKDEDYGECRRYAPSTRSFTYDEEEEIAPTRKIGRIGADNMMLSDIQVYASWPVTHRNQLCGEYKEEG